jgi:hypothetical protein
MTHETTTSLAPAEILRRARDFFANRVPNHAAFPEKEGLTWLALRGQGGEEIVIGVTATAGGSRVRASTLFFDQAVSRFLSTLPGGTGLPA